MLRYVYVGERPVQVVAYDWVGYIGSGKFILLNWARDERKVDEMIEESGHTAPVGVGCTINNNQRILFIHHEATLHDINGEWFYKKKTVNAESALTPLPADTFFQIVKQE